MVRRRVFINLFNNAQHAMQNGGEIIVWTGKTLQDVLVSVRDTGTGIPDDIKNKTFHPFFTTKEVGKGTGFGLSITYGKVQEHCGTITVESPVIVPKPHKQSPGTAFHIRLPASQKQNVNDEEHQ